MTKATRDVDTPKLAAAAAATVAAGAGIAAGRIGLEHVRRTPTSRVFRLKSGEAVGEGLLRIACGRLDHALDELRGNSDSDPVEAVHEARKDIKKLRALLRLTRDRLGAETYRRENTELREIARALSELRDADVLAETLDKLAADCPDLVTPAAAGRLRAALDVRRRTLAQGKRARDAAVEQAADRLEVVGARMEDWPLDGDGWQLMGEGMRRSYRRGRRRMRDARRETSDEALHEWRKRVKDQWYQLRLVRCAWPPVLDPVAEEAHRLSDLLGDEHDLGVLGRHVSESPPGPASDRDRERLAEAIERRRSQLREAAFAGGARLYAEGPNAYERRMARYWQAQGTASERC